MNEHGMEWNRLAGTGTGNLINSICCETHSYSMDEQHERSLINLCAPNCGTNVGQAFVILCMLQIVIYILLIYI